MEEYGTVCKINGDKAIVRIERKSACSKCNVCKSTDSLQEVFCEIENNLNFCLGDKVILEISNNNLLISSFLLYVLPLIFFLFGLFLGYYLFIDNYFLVSICCIMFLAIGFFIVKVIEKKLAHSQLLKARKG